MHAQRKLGCMVAQLSHLGLGSSLACPFSTSGPGTQLLSTSPPSKDVKCTQLTGLYYRLKNNDQKDDMNKAFSIMELEPKMNN